MRKRREKPEDVALSFIAAGKDRDCFLVREVPLKGRGVFAREKLEKGEFLLQYNGKIITWTEGDKLEAEDSTGYRFFLSFREKRFCVDASVEPTTGPVLGRLVNHGEKGEKNVKVSVINDNGFPAMCLFALRDIQEGEELLYDYGVKNLPWQKVQTNNSSRSMESGPGEETEQDRATTNLAGSMESGPGGETEQDGTTTNLAGSMESGPGGETEQDGTTTNLAGSMESGPGGETEQDGTTTNLAGSMESGPGGEPEQDRTTTNLAGSMESGPGGEPEQDRTTTNLAGSMESGPGGEPEQDRTTTNLAGSMESGPGGEPEQDRTTTNSAGSMESGPGEGTEQDRAGPCRWADQVDKLRNDDVPQKRIGRLKFSKELKIADGSNGAKLFVGLLDDKLPVAVKRVENTPSKESDVQTILRASEAGHLLYNLHTEEDEDFLYHASVLCEGDLEEIVEGKVCLLASPPENICHQMMLGVGELHEKNILHRDLKPKNVLIDDQGKVYLGDFGISRCLSSGTTLLTKAMGTLCWTSSDALTNPPRYKKSSDIQMLGCLIYYVLTGGHMPYQTKVPYTSEPEGILLNMKRGSFNLDRLGRYSRFQPLLEGMLNPNQDDRPSIEECIACYEEEILASRPGDMGSLGASTSREPGLLLATSGLKGPEKDQVENLAIHQGGSLNPDVGRETTHLIIRTDEYLSCSRTLKYLQAISRKIWIVSYEWVLSSLKAGRLLPEEEFEVAGDDTIGLQHGAKLARTSTSSVLQGYAIEVTGCSSLITQDDVRSLAALNGATITTPSSQGNPGNTVIVSLEQKESASGSRSSSIRGTKIPVMNLDWLMDTIAVQVIQSPKNYKLKVHDDISAVPNEASPEESATCPKVSGEEAPSSSYRKTRRKRVRFEESSSDSEADAQDEPPQPPLTVKSSTKKNGKRVHDKAHVCFFCETKQTHIARHLTLVHSEEADVAAILVHKKGSQMRKRLFKLLVNKGDRAHNFDVLESGKGTLIACRQPPDEKAPGDYLFCGDCSGLFLGKDLWRHKKVCISRKKEATTDRQQRHQHSARNLLPVPPDISSNFWKVLCDMNQDEVSRAVQSDPLIMKFGAQLFKKHGKMVGRRKKKVIYDASNGDYIRQKMRETGRLLLEGRKLGLRSIADFVLPENFKVVVDAVKKVAGFDEDTLTFKTPSLVLKCGHNLFSISSIAVCEAAMANDADRAQLIERFQKIYRTMWNAELSSTALGNLRESRWNKDVAFPSHKDVQKLNTFLRDEIESEEQSLIAEATMDGWVRLTRLSLCYLIVFNRRRVGEVSKVTLETYTTAMTREQPANEDLVACLSEVEARLASHFKRVEIRGKRGRKVPLLLSPLIVRVMNLLTETREALQIDSPYLFANPNATARLHFRGSDVLRSFAEQCGAAFPTTLRSTILRKHLATTCQILNLSSTDLESLAAFMGHDIRVHEHFYRLQEGLMQAAKLSKILLAHESGNLAAYQGKTLSEIDPTPAAQHILVDESDGSEGEEEEATNKPEEELTEPVPEPTRPAKRRHKKSKGKKKWSSKERAAVSRHFSRHIKKNIAVKKQEALACLAEESCLSGRDWRAIKWQVKNQATTYQRKYLSKDK